MLNNILTHFSKIFSNISFSPLPLWERSLKERVRGEIILLDITCLMVQSCSDTLDDEKYATIGGGFPKLVDVPDRPQAMSAKEIDHKKHQLDADRLEAEKLAEQNYKMATK